MTDDRRPTTDDRRPTTDDRRPTTDGRYEGRRVRTNSECRILKGKIQVGLWIPQDKYWG
jgi:hypothetical protein